MYYFTGKGVSGGDLKRLATDLNRRRVAILEDMRQRRLLVDASLDKITDGGKDENSHLFVFLRTIFDETR